MTGAIALFLALTTTLAAIVVLYAVGVARAFASPRIARPVVALIPVATPVIAWRAGARATSIALVACALLYVLLQLVAAAR
jgi:hypothetical protein